MNESCRLDVSGGEAEVMDEKQLFKKSVWLIAAVQETKLGKN